MRLLHLLHPQAPPRRPPPADTATPGPDLHRRRVRALRPAHGRDDRHGAGRPLHLRGVPAHVLAQCVRRRAVHLLSRGQAHAVCGWPAGHLYRLAGRGRLAHLPGGCGPGPAGGQAGRPGDQTRRGGRVLPGLRRASGHGQVPAWCLRGDGHPGALHLHRRLHHRWRGALRRGEVPLLLPRHRPLRRPAGQRLRPGAATLLWGEG